RSSEMNNPAAIPLNHKLLVHNLVVHKFDYEKRVYSRYFDASSADNLERYLYPARVLPRARAQFREQVNVVLGELGSLILQNAAGPEPKPIEVTRADAQAALRQAVRQLLATTAPSPSRDVLDNLLQLARHLDCPEATEAVLTQLRRLDKTELEERLAR